MQLKNQPLKTRLHNRNRNREPYDLKSLVDAIPKLKNHIKPNKYGGDSVDFSSPIAVKLLNQALLKHYYDINNWQFPYENLCPPIPGRADYLHYIADLLSESNAGEIQKGSQICGLDVGVGATCIYPIIGVTEYDWNFIASDIDPKSIASAQQIIDSNPSLKDKVDCRLQKDSTAIFQGIIDKKDKIDFTISNPPFHASIEEAQRGSRRKIRNLSGKKVTEAKLNFSGAKNELIYDGGEYQFIKNMIRESEEFAKSCFWFSTLISKQSNLKGTYKLLEKVKPTQLKTIAMGTGNKSSRIIAWTFLSKEEQKVWKEDW
ncbi:23S rRNA (adenine(1618)-N(6))-methyltransferase RlmF [Salegentibacter salegens]|uniref:Ribosomal RNA large subunit methyltransferase F n=1 Tax=Salegentibacter salegens TaxID=143223 RepID=A0A1M7J8V8_9FLAO|nr:23S rRNA (adenine(1618)-N(6))-methyltransferase RlmF [Salegentibacter salegens]PRX47312.1 23S rRNA (adenine1618-N6)-methyltransferase [Salegentibacter salegens]SHM49424.1 23S rRNA m(6)A-1618 methyltransferase [Salegentibacter salegens]